MEGEVNYASVVFKVNKPSPAEASAKGVEETVYDEVKVQDSTADPSPDTQGFLGERPAKGCRGARLAAWCLGILCVILVLAIIVLGLYFAAAVNGSDAKLVKQWKENQSSLLAVHHNLITHITKLNSEISLLKQDHGVLESKIENLSSEKSALEEQIENMKGERSELNLTRAQWTLDAYCPKTGNPQERKCNACLSGWLKFTSSCYVIMDSTEESEHKTWEEARENCRERNADLVVIKSPEEKDFIRKHSWGSKGSPDYWIGLSGPAGIWKWVDGSDLTEHSWIQKPSSNAHCVISVKESEVWRCEDCAKKNRWICEMSALSV